VLAALHNLFKEQRAERLFELQQIMRNASSIDIAIISYLYIIKNTKFIITNKVVSHNYEIDNYVFLWHAVNFDLNVALGYLSKGKQDVIIELLRGNLFPQTEVLEHIPELYTMKEIEEVLADRKAFYYISSVPQIEYIFKNNRGNVYSNFNHKYEDNLLRGVCHVRIDDGIWGGLPLFQWLEQKKHVPFPKEFLHLPTKLPPCKGKFLHTFNMSGVKSEYKSYPIHNIKPYDWLIDKNYNAIGVKYKLADKEKTFLIENCSQFRLSEITLEVEVRGKSQVVSAKLVHTKQT
jgi:hypothetical protein